MYIFIVSLFMSNLILSVFSFINLCIYSQALSSANLVCTEELASQSPSLLLAHFNCMDYSASHISNRYITESYSSFFLPVICHFPICS